LRPTWIPSFGPGTTSPALRFPVKLSRLFLSPFFPASLQAFPYEQHPLQRFAPHFFDSFFLQLAVPFFAREEIAPYLFTLASFPLLTKGIDDFLIEFFSPLRSFVLF